MTATHHHPGMTSHPATTRQGIAARIRGVGERLSGRVHAAADDRTQALRWEVTKTPGWLGLSGRSYRDPRFAARRDRQPGRPRRDGAP